MKYLLSITLMLLLSASTVLAQDFCKGDFTFDGDVDGEDVTEFLKHFGRGQYDRPCPPDGPAPVPKTGWLGEETGVEWPVPRFTDNGDGTVTDNLTGLIWLKDANRFGSSTWASALSDCNTLADDGSSLTDGSTAGDWRLPNLFELESLRTMRYYDPCISDTTGTGHWSEGDPFNNVQSYFYWSITDFPLGIATFWAVDMEYGEVFSFYIADVRYVWPVRGGH